VLAKRLKSCINKDATLLESKSKESETRLNDRTVIKIKSGSIKAGDLETIRERTCIECDTKKGEYYNYVSEYLQIIFHKECTEEFLSHLVEGILKGQYVDSGPTGVGGVTLFGRNPMWDQIVYVADAETKETDLPVGPAMDEEEFEPVPLMCATSESAILFATQQEYRYCLLAGGKAFVCTGYEISGDEGDDTDVTEELQSHMTVIRRIAGF